MSSDITVRVRLALTFAGIGLSAIAVNSEALLSCSPTTVLIVPGLISLSLGIVPAAYQKRRSSGRASRVVDVLAATVLLSGFVILVFGTIVVGIGLLWLMQGRTCLSSFAFFEWIPFFALGMLFVFAALGLSGVQRWAWWLAFVGSLTAIVEGIYRYTLSLSYLAGATTPWVSSNPGALATVIAGAIVAGFALVTSQIYRGVVTREA